MSERAAFLCVDGHAARFERLKVAVRDYDHSVHIQLCRTFEAALKTVAEQTFSVVVIAREFGENDTKAFIAQVAACPGGQDAAFVLLVSTDSGEYIEEQMSVGLVLGANGFLMEPFSVSAVKDTLALAQSVKSERLLIRQKQRIKEGLGPARKLIDRLANARRTSGSGRETIDSGELTRIRDAIRECENENSDLYFRVVVGTFIRISKDGIKVGAENYFGSSPRVKAQIAQRLAAASEAEELPFDDTGDSKQ